MSKRIIIFSLILFSSFVTTSVLGALAPTITPNLSNQRDNTLNALFRPKASAAKVTEKWVNDDGPSQIKQVVISADGNYIAAIYESSKNVTLFHRDSNSTIWEFEAADFIDEIAISWNGSYIVACDDTNVYLLNSTEENPKTAMWKFNGTMPVTSDIYVDISLDGKYTAVGIGHDFEALYLLNNSYSQNKKEEWQVDTNIVTDLPSCVSISGDANFTVFGDDSTGHVHLFNKTKIPSKIAEWKYDTTATIKDVEMSHTGDYFIATNDQNEAYLFNTTDYQGIPTWKFSKPGNLVQDIAISADGNFSVVCYAGTVYYLNNTFSALTSQKEPLWEWNAGDLKDVDISADGKYIVIATGSGATLYLLNSTKTAPKVEEWKDYDGDEVYVVSINALGDYFVAGISLPSSIYRISLFHHDISIPTIPPGLLGGGDDDDDDDDDEERAIPFGGYYLLFFMIGIISSIIIMKRKIAAAKNE